METHSLIKIPIAHRIMTWRYTPSVSVPVPVVQIDYQITGSIETDGRYRISRFLFRLQEKILIGHHRGTNVKHGL